MLERLDSTSDAGTSSMPEHLSQYGGSPMSAEQGSPLHGYRGERRTTPTSFTPVGLTVTISREAGSRGTSIAKRAGEKLGWQIYTQEMLEYIAQEATVRDEIIGNLPPAGLRWVEEQLERLQSNRSVHGNAALFEIARVILALGASGEVLLIGRGAGCILPRGSTLHVRIVAPLEDRIAYMSQWQRLTREEAAEQVKLRDRRRAEYLRTHFEHNSSDIYQYDLVLNSTLLGEDLSAELLLRAARAKSASLLADTD
jgi:cytidylate kinase